jgi:hypothetical protein
MGSLFGYNRFVAGREFSRRRFFEAAALLAGGAWASGPWAPPTPAVPRTATGEPREYFVPLDAYHELPPECYADNLIRPREIILHWDGNRHGRDQWVAPITFETLRLLGQSAHFAVDYKRVWQMLPMYATLAQESHGAQGYNWAAINVELAGTEFDTPGSEPPEGEVRQAVALAARLMDHYHIPFERVYGHFERDPRGDKRDPGARFMASFREGLADYRRGQSPLKAERLA